VGWVGKIYRVSLGHPLARFGPKTTAATAAGRRVSLQKPFDLPVVFWQKQDPLT